MSYSDSFVKSDLCKSQVLPKGMNFIVLVSIKTHYPEYFIHFSSLSSPTFSFLFQCSRFLFLLCCSFFFCFLFVLPNTGFGLPCHWLLLPGKNLSHTLRSCLGTFGNSFDLGDQVCIVQVCKCAEFSTRTENDTAGVVGNEE